MRSRIFAPPRPVLLLLLLAGFALALPGAALAHTRLEASVPANGAVLEEPVREIRLRFSGRVEPLYTSVSVSGPAGPLVTASAGDLIAEPGEREFVLRLPQPLGRGAYTVQWRTVAADGHVVQGTFGFAVEVEEPTAPMVEAPPQVELPAPEHHPLPATVSPVVEPSAPLPVVVRWLHFLALLGMIGAVVFRLGVVPSLERDGRCTPAAVRAALRCWGVAAAAVALSFAVLIARLWVQSAALHGMENAWSPQHLSTMLRITTWGSAWLLQAGMIALFLIGLLLARSARRGPGGWGVAAVAVLGLSLVPALSGHAVGTEGVSWPVVLNDSLHVFSAGAWLGTLGVLLLAGLPAALTLPRSDRAWAVAVTVGLFSPIALASAGLVSATGVINSLWHFSALAELWETQYGRTLLLKLAVLSVAIGTGFYNWRFVRPGLAVEDAASGRLQRSAGVEIAAGIVVILITAILVALPRP